MSDTAEPTMLARREGAAGTLLMNRPKTLNALDIEMIRGFQSALDAWTGDAAVRLVRLEGAGGRAFCAGGDVRRIRGSRSPATPARSRPSSPRNMR
ncbi:enoyl-CoA hydratase/isomerase family protein [Siccirubricoccus sp. G192]|uniref:enoyl-CoA hydratase/isomerase family protein n=1 Tax=Siccirubricoccus sp. G192 TaxID=2849651 RepID=UPI0028123C7C|nr:enoyl-CoA hydratase/isomerase family protein [Siccirubricoccus sp. G192]